MRSNSVRRRRLTPESATQSPERRPVSQSILSGDGRHPYASLDPHLAGRGGDEVPLHRLNATARPAAICSSDGSNPELTVSMQGDVGSAGAHRLDLACAPLTLTAGISSTGIDDPFRSLRRGAFRAIEVICEEGFGVARTAH